MRIEELWQTGLVMTSHNHMNDTPMNSNKKQRDALVEADIILSSLGYDASSPIRLQIKDALDETVRNCDIGTASEQYARYCRDIEKYTGKSILDLEGHYELTAKYFAHWSQMPFEKGENDE